MTSVVICLLWLYRAFMVRVLVLERGCLVAPTKTGVLKKTPIWFTLSGNSDPILWKTGEKHELLCVFNLFKQFHIQYECKKTHLWSMYAEGKVCVWLVWRGKAGARTEAIGCFILLRSASVGPQHCPLLQDARDRQTILVVCRHPTGASQKPSLWLPTWIVFNHPCGFESFKRWAQLRMEPGGWRELWEVRPAEAGRGGWWGGISLASGAISLLPSCRPHRGSLRSWKAGVALRAWCQREKEKQPGNLWNSLPSAGGRARKSPAGEWLGKKKERGKKEKKS